MWHCRADWIKDFLVTTCRLTTLTFPWKKPVYFLILFLTLYGKAADCGWQCFSKHTDNLEKKIRKNEFCRSVHKMHMYQKYVNDNKRWPEGIKIYLSHVTPIGNKQLDCFLCHFHTLSYVCCMHASITLQIPAATKTQ